MNSSQSKKIEKKIKEEGYKQSSYDPNRYSNGKTKIVIDSNNGYNHNGSKVRSYDNCKDHLNKD